MGNVAKRLMNAAAVIWLMALAVPAWGDTELTVGDLCRLKGQEENVLQGVGFVVGLKGTGDGDGNKTMMRALARALQNFGAPVATDTQGRLLDKEMANAKNVAMVFVTVKVPPEGLGRIAAANDLFASAFAALKLGASGYILKSASSERFFDTLASLLRGEVVFSTELAARLLAEFAPAEGAAEPAGGATPPLPGLTERQTEVLRLVARGFTYKEVGARLYMAERTVKYHMGEILNRLHIQSRKEADKKRIGILGHSEGGLIAPMVAARETEVAFLILLAGLLYFTKKKVWASSH